MRRHGVLRSILLSTFLTPFAVGSALAYCSTIGLPADRQVAEIQTSLGQVCIELFDDPDEAPGHVENFLWYADNDHLVGTFFHRAVDDFVLQGASFRYDEGVGIGRNEPRPGVEVTNEPCELDTDVPAGGGIIQVCSERGNEAYTVALAKLADQPNSGTTSWFVNLGDNRTNLDNQNGGFTVFGRVMYSSGQAVVREIMGVSRLSDAAEVPEEQLELGDYFWPTGGVTDLYGQSVPILGDAPLPISYGPDVGCSDMTSLATVLNEDLSNLLWQVLDPEDDPPPPLVLTVSASCGTPLDVPFVDWVPQPGPPSCPGLDRIALRSVQPAENSPYPGALTPFEYITYTCEQLETAVENRDVWRDTEAATFLDDFAPLPVYIESVTIRVAVPEPTGAAAALAALVTLGWLRRRASDEHQI